MNYKKDKLLFVLPVIVVYSIYAPDRLPRSLDTLLLPWAIGDQCKRVEGLLVACHADLLRGH